MSEKKSFILRIDSNTYKLLEKWAADEFRSVNGQIEYILHQSLMLAVRRKVKLTKTVLRKKNE
ncbi:MAG TPA: Arc family DNA binding domain-containing protein [Niabella sp.]|nr:Arc family DNA binding domain-containing protein [Niabella sp.]